eukprot:CAMPEP_0185736520 /NCGR_PEP_ID=MMETSP1171-20130828/28107_1 /TAXON_ID=374046 /ORGANISM="Helicotheca tamensis, Strain CCMP826" /LENGTH=33 /DNA_ID= /DNA_START= /DNA_END= /DNA_ORIENTATION=
MNDDKLRGKIEDKGNCWALAKSSLHEKTSLSLA